MFSYLVMGFVSSVTMAFFYGWKLTLVMLTCAPVLTIAQAMVCKVQTNLKEREMEAYGKAGSVAEEVFSSIKTVMAFSGQKKEIERFVALVSDAVLLLFYKICFDCCTGMTKNWRILEKLESEEEYSLAWVEGSCGLSLTLVTLLHFGTAFL